MSLQAHDDQIPSHMDVPAPLERAYKSLLILGDSTAPTKSPYALFYISDYTPAQKILLKMRN